MSEQINDNHEKPVAGSRAVADDAIWARPKQAERIANVSQTTIKKLVREGTVVSIKLGRSRLISVQSLRDLGQAQAA